MPPRIQPHRMPIPSTCQCFRTRPSADTTLVDAAQQTRHFRRAANVGFVNPKMTRLRREMVQWLQGPGKVFLAPLNGSTNYMSAYDKQGNLVRAKRQRESGREAKVIPEEQEAEIQRKEIESGMDAEERQSAYEARRAARDAQADKDSRDGRPRERTSDMRPYPLNTDFRSQPVLSEDLREALYQQVVLRGTDIGTVSAAFGVDMRRVAAVVRLKSIEKRWAMDGKRLAKPYNDAVMAMLPQTPYRPDSQTEKIVSHESINDLPVHPKTRQQLFYPTSESRQFTREDAAKAFDEHLLPADSRIPHPELITLEKEHLAGIDRDTRWRRQQERDEQARKDKAKAEEKKKEWEERTQRVVPGRRWDFKFQDFSAEKTGRDGRARNAVGVRYGMPHEDRKRGMVKIPTSVE